MKVQVVCKVPNGQEPKPIKILCGGCQKNADGSFSFNMEFDTKVEATQWLYDRAYEIAKDNKELKQLNSQIRVHKKLTYEKATVKIKRAKK
jgi:hypothetical protein